MSSCTTVYSLDSKIQAPEIGDAGHVGAPPVDAAGHHHFNVIYDALKMIGLVTEELDGFRAFLDQYGDDELYFFVEGGDDSDIAKRLDAIMEAEDLPQFKFEPAADYQQCYYKISVDEQSLTSSEPASFCQTESFTVAKSELTDLIQQVFKPRDWDIHFYNLWGVLDPYDGDLEQIRDFVLAHDGPFTVEFAAPPS